MELYVTPGRVLVGYGKPPYIKSYKGWTTSWVAGIMKVIWISVDLLYGYTFSSRRYLGICRRNNVFGFASRAAQRLPALDYRISRSIVPWKDHNFIETIIQAR